MAAFCATSLTLKGGLITFSALIIFFEPYPHPTLREDKPYILENVLKIKTFHHFSYIRHMHHLQLEEYFFSIFS